MALNLSRRGLLATAPLLALGSCTPQRMAGGAVVASSGTLANDLSAIENSVGGRVGVFALDTATGHAISHRADERFAMCSTFKWTLAAAILARIDRHEIGLEDRLRYGESDLLDLSPVTRAHVAEGSMTVAALAEAAVVVSDNAAANLLLTKLGGPTALTRFFRALGDDVTRLDRNEPTLNSNLPGDARDTTTPRAMVHLLRAVFLGNALSSASVSRLSAWMRACETGLHRLRAGMPRDWVVGDKTGTGDRGAVNDVAVAIPPNGAPVLIAAYLSDSEATVERLSEAHKAIARTVVRSLSAG